MDTRKAESFFEQLTDLYDKMRECYEALGEACKSYQDFTEASKCNGHTNNA